MLCATTVYTCIWIVLFALFPYLSHCVFPQQKREEFLRNLQKQDEELVAQEAELKEQQRQAEEEERMKSDEDHNRDSTLLPFDYASYRSSSQMSGLDETLASPDSILDSDSSLLSPVPGSTLWEDEESVVVLDKGSQGLGFSILDFAVS